MRIKKRRSDGVVQGYHILGRGHSAEALDIGKGKVLKKFTGIHKDATIDRDNEFKKYMTLELYKSPVIVPMTWTKEGLKMPKLSVVTRSSLPREYRVHGYTFVEGGISDSQLQTLKHGLRELSENGIFSWDILHVGISKSGKPYFFDIGGFEKSKDVMNARDENSEKWKKFCEKIGRPNYGELFPEYRPKPLKQLVKEFNNELGGKDD